jgi:protein-S-isoprenylcysteine O-methyltransferase Ste14
METNRGPGTWWAVKVLAGATLIAYSCAALVLEWRARSNAGNTVIAGQGLVLVGAGIHLWHYAILKRHARNLAGPVRLVTTGGLFGRVRHPMYLGDMIWAAGFGVLAADLVAAALCVLCWIAIPLQCRHEDRAMASAFGQEHALWARHARALIPFLY